MYDNNKKLINVLNPDDAFINKYFHYIIGNYIALGNSSSMTDANNLVISPVIKVNQGDIVYVRMIYTGNGKIVIADKDKKAINIINAEIDKSDYMISIPNNGRYIQYFGRSNINGIQWNTHDMITINMQLPDEFVNYGITKFQYLYNKYNKIYTDIVNFNTSWYGKKCSLLGSSLTANGGWSDILKERFGFSKIYNRGIGGTTLTNFSQCGFTDYVTSFKVYNDVSQFDENRNTVFASQDSDSNLYTICSNAWYSSENRIMLLPQDSDLVLIDLAVNDYFRTYNNNLDWDHIFNIPVINTNYRQRLNPPEYDDKKFGDAFVLMIKRIKYQCPNAKIIVWGMLYNSAIATYDIVESSPSDSLEKYYELNEYIKKLCSYFGIYFINMLSETDLNVYNLTEYCEDGIHPYKSTYATENGKYMIANVMTNHLKNIYPKNYNF